MSWRRVVAAGAGPLLIAALVFLALRGFWTGPHLTNEHPDLLAFWLPRWSFLGRTLAAGQIPVWNPYEMLGYRFAADPQSGWLYLPPMALFTALSPGVAMRAMIVLQPLLAGVGLYAFLRVDGVGRVGATAGGLAIAGAMAASEVAIAMPFAGALAWTSIALLAAAGYLRADRWSRRLGWIALGGFAWSQIAGAHLSHGLVAGTAVLVAYLIARTGRVGWARTALFLAALPVLALPVLVPRFQFVSVSSLAGGYEALGGVAGVTADEEAPISVRGVWAGWPLALGAAPGAYLGAVTLLAVPLALRARRRRRVAIAFAVVLAAVWILLLPAVLEAGWVRERLLALPFGDVALHNPGRFRYVALMTLPALAAFGIDGVLREPPSRRAAAIWVGAGAALWVGVPLVAGGDAGRWRLFALALIPAATLLVLAARRRRWGPLLVGLLAIELAVGAVLAGRHTGDEIVLGLEGLARAPLAFQPLRAPDVDLDTFLAPSPFASAIGDDPYLTWAPPAAAYEKGYLFAQEPSDWAALANERGTLFGLRDALGYNPVQLPAYWRWMRERNPLPMHYNVAVLARPRLGDLQTMGVRFVVVPQGVTPPFPGDVVATAGGYDLIEVARPPVTDVEPVVRRTGPTTVEVTSPTLGLPVIVDAAWDPGWSATDGLGRPVALAPYGPVLQVPPGDRTREVTLRYRDPWVTRSLAAGVLAWGALLAAIVACAIRERSVRGAAGSA
ncbi:MAG TPA: hypothetical protein VE032_09150 [Actinomycetota bacterium]|nr:hypothetical protein [Actinomycetota bacterium]